CREVVTAWVNEHLFTPGTSLPAVLAVLGQSQAQLRDWLTESRRTLADLERAQEQQAIALSQAESELAGAAASLPLGRKRRVHTALATLFQVAEAFYQGQLQLALLQGQHHIWNGMVTHLDSLERQVE